MTPKQIVDAYRCINELFDIVFPYKTTRELVKLKKRIKDEFDTVYSTERAMVAKYGGTIDKDKTYHFPDMEATAQFAEEHNEFYEQDVDIKLPVVDLSRFTEAIRISPAAMEALDGIVIFDKDDK